jgi:hypothetical protein
MITFSKSGDFGNTERFLKNVANDSFFANLDSYGKAGVQALADNTPRDSGETAQSWGYKVIRSRTNPGIEWYNTNVNDGTSVAILIQYGHATKSGGYISGRDYINPVIRPIFDKIAEDIWKKVTA